MAKPVAFLPDDVVRLKERHKWVGTVAEVLNDDIVLVVVEGIPEAIAVNVERLEFAD